MDRVYVEELDGFVDIFLKRCDRVLLPVEGAEEVGDGDNDSRPVVILELRVQDSLGILQGSKKLCRVIRRETAGT